MTKSHTYSLSVTLGGTALLLFALYLPLNLQREHMHWLETAADRHIPFMPVFVLPYVSYYFFLVIAALLLAYRRKVERLEQYLLATILSLVVAYVFYGFFQTYVIRPEIIVSGPLTRLVAGIYKADNPYNDFPSLHVTLSILASICLYRQVKADKALAAWGVLIAISTVFIKQHYVMDVAGGIVLAVFSYCVSRFAFAGRNAIAH